MTDLARRDATELVALITNRQVTAVDVLKASLERIAALEPILHAWTCLEPEMALAAAGRIDAELARGTFKGRLPGIPVGIKDIFNTADMPTEMGSRIWTGFQPGNDARVVFNLRYDGAVIPGKTKTSEFAVHEPTDTVNPWALDRAPGTSSSGSAAAVASAMIPVALGSQTGGSTIRPASYCGIVGFKPSFGLVPRTGVLKTTDTLDTVAWFARSIDDAELLFDVVRVSGRNYPFVNERVERRELPRPMKLGVVHGPTWKSATPDAQRAFEELVDELRSSDECTVDEVQVPFVDEVFDAHEAIYCKALSYYFRGEHRNDRAKISGVLDSMLQKGESISPDTYHQLVQRQAALTREVNGAFSHDAWVVLAAAGEAPVGLRTPDRPDTCRVWTYLGMPALTIPAMRGAAGLPIGCQLVSAKYNDYQVLDVGRRVSQILGVRAEISDVEPRLVHD